MIADVVPSSLSIDRITLDFTTFDGDYHALEDVSLSVGPGESLGIVGETGCGKSVLAKSVLRLLESPPARYVGGRIFWAGRDLLNAPEKELRRVRGTEISMIFQDPTTFLDPLYPAGDHIIEALVHSANVRGKNAHKADIRAAALRLLDQLGMPDPVRALESYPHQLSGGMRQRILIAGAMAGNPQLLIADEPTTALDVTVQAQILRLLKNLIEYKGVGIMLISHDLGVIASVCQRIAVMYAGTIVETGYKADILRQPHHPYTRGLIASVPRLHSGTKTFSGIRGQIPNLLKKSAGCRFADRCDRATARCCLEKPRLRAIAAKHLVACHNLEAE